MKGIRTKMAPLKKSEGRMGINDLEIMICMGLFPVVLNSKYKSLHLTLRDDAKMYSCEGLVGEFSNYIMWRIIMVKRSS